MPASSFYIGEQSKGDDCMDYRNKEWLYYEYYEQRRTCDDIAGQFGVNRKTVSYFLKKFGIQKPCQESEITVDVACQECKQATSKRLRYLKQRIRRGETKFYCKKCVAKLKSESHSGKNNPNYGGKWHGPPHSEIFTKEQLSRNAKNNIEKWKENGHFEVMLKKLQNGHREFFATPEGKAMRSANGVKAVLNQSDRNRRTSIEIKMAEELTSRGIEYIEQYNLGNKFALDFFLPEYGIVVECDGDYWHRLPKNVARDKSKNAYVKACGFSMYRFWESEINSDVESCVDVVMAEINAKEAI
jgi:very-short-patch-repair endonuclease